MSEASELGAALGACLSPADRAAGGVWRGFTPESPVGGVRFFGICNHAMNNGLELTFVVEGPNAEEAAGRVRRLLNKPPPRDEISAKAIRWAGGNRGSRSPAGGYERAELTAELPGERGFECIFYQYIARATAHLRARVYVKVVAEGEEFRPSGLAEHFPVAELRAYQLAAGRLAGTGEEALGKDRRLEATFVCYSPPGSGAAEEAAAGIRTALEKLREVATWNAVKRGMFGARHGVGAAAAPIGDPFALSYRPPEGVLSRRPRPPEPPPRPRSKPKKTIAEAAEAQLRRWGFHGAADDYRRQIERDRERLKSRGDAGAGQAPSSEGAGGEGP